MWTTLVVFNPSSLDQALSFGDHPECMDFYAIVLQGFVESLDDGILGWSARLRAGDPAGPEDRPKVMCGQKLNQSID